MEAEVSEIKSGQKWAIRTTIAAAVTAVGSIGVWLLTEVIPKLL